MNETQKGEFAFDVPPKIKQGKQERVEVRIAKDTGQAIEDILRVNLRPTAQVEQIQVAPFMIVRLKGVKDSSFEVVPLTDERQAVGGSGYTTWAWSVIPQESGQQTLYLTVGTRFKLPNQTEESKFAPLYQRSITVDVDRIYATKRFISVNWQVLTVSILVPLIAYAWQHRWKRRSKGTELLP